MKLKELHLRNIASIERADIDFEHGLNDAITGDPASIFLISGDTGAGKSVILDGISMALFKTTPRIDSVANKQRNDFANDDGVALHVNSIEQYTRLGISHKDECYSEVVFEDNHGKTYHARLGLGMSKKKITLSSQRDEALAQFTQAKTQLDLHQKNIKHLKEIEAELDKAKQRFLRWDRLNSIFGGTRFRTLVQTYILRPLLNNANIYLEQITDRYRLTCSEDNEQLSILVLDRYNKDQVRSVTVLSGGERFMISLALSLALSSLNRPDMNVNILFIDEGFGTLDERSLDSVMSTLEKLQEIAGQTNRRVGIISHREELEERIPVKILTTFFLDIFNKLIFINIIFLILPLLN